MNSDNQRSNTYAFSIRPPPPTITGVNPNPVPGTTGLHLVTITGANFVNKPTVINSWTVFGGGSGPVEPSRVTFVSSTEIRVQVNISVAPDTQSFQVVNADGQASNVWTYTIDAPSTITGVDSDVVPAEIDSRFGISLLERSRASRVSTTLTL